MMRARVLVRRGMVVAGVCLAVVLPGCDVLDEEQVCDCGGGGAQVLDATIHDGTAVSDAKVRAFFWFGEHVTDPRNFILSEAEIDPEGHFRMVLPKPPAELLIAPEVPVQYADSTFISVSDFSVVRSNYVEFSLFDPAGEYIYMMYQTNRPQVEVALPLYFGYFVYFSGPVHIDGIRTVVFPGYFGASGEWIEKTVIDRYHYDDVQFTEGWNLYYVETVSSAESPERLERDFAVLGDRPENMAWHLYYRPDLEP